MIVRTCRTQYKYSITKITICLYKNQNVNRIKLVAYVANAASNSLIDYPNSDLVVKTQLTQPL